MTNRTTIKEVEGLVNRLNRVTGNSLESWTRTADGKTIANVGNYYLDGAYGGHRLVQIMNEGGGIRTIGNSGFASKREAYNSIYSYLCGIEDCIRAEKELQAKIAAI